MQDAETYCLRNDVLTEDEEDKITQPMIVLLSVLFRPVESYVFKNFERLHCYIRKKLIDILTHRYATPLPRPKSEYRAHAMTLLMKHAQPRPPSWSGLDPVSILDVFPDSMPLSSALPYFALSVPCLHHRLRHSQATKHLCKYDTQILLRSKLLSAQNRKANHQ